MTKIAVLGMGRMGKEIVRMAIDAGLEVAAALDSEKNPVVGSDAGSASGIEPLGVLVRPASELEDVLDSACPDVVIDFTSPEACMKNYQVICEKKINMVIGTTGLAPGQIAKIREKAEAGGAGVVLSPNMSVGVNVFWELIKEAAKMLPGYDIEIIEKHHRFKKDAPSGTALKSAEVIAEALGEKLSDVAVYGREGVAERKKGEIGIHAVRAGDIVGEHTAIYSDLQERIEISHIAHSRSAFVSGVIQAAEFINGKKGFYSMKEVLGF